MGKSRKLKHYSFIILAVQKVTHPKNINHYVMVMEVKKAKKSYLTSKLE